MGTQNHGYKLKVENFRLQSISSHFKAVPSVPKEVPILNHFTVQKFISPKIFKDFFFKIFKIKGHEIFSNLSYKKFREYLRYSILPSISLII